MTGGLVLIVAGIWVLSQILGGNALGRLGIAGAPTTPGKASIAPGAAVGSAVGSAVAGG